MKGPINATCRLDFDGTTLTVRSITKDGDGKSGVWSRTYENCTVFDKENFTCTYGNETVQMVGGKLVVDSNANHLEFKRHLMIFGVRVD